MFFFIVSVTGSTSLRLTWDPSQVPGATFTVFRSLDSVFSHATQISGILALNTPWYNDYTVSPATEYFYWLVDQNDNQYGPDAATTLPATNYQEPIDEPQLNALQEWAYSIWDGLYPAYWRYQPIPQPIKPKILLNIIAIKDGSWSDNRINSGEGLEGCKVATVSVMVSSDPQQPVRGLLNVSSLEATTYSMTVNGTPVSVTYAMAPTGATQVMSALQAQLDALVPLQTNDLQYGLDPNNQGLIVENVDPRGPLAVTVTGPLTFSTYTPPKAMLIAQRLMGSLQDPFVRENLSAQGIGVGNRHSVNDVSSMLETTAELVAQFDFYVSLAQVYPINGPIIDTASAVGTYIP